MKEKPFVKEGEKPDDRWTPLIRGSLINRYLNLWNENYWILYGKWLAAPRKAEIFEVPEKIVVRQTGDSIVSVIIDNSFIARDNLHIIITKNDKYSLKYIIGIMNSKLIDFYYSIMNPEKGEALAQVKKAHVENLPIMPIINSNQSICDNVINFVDQMIKSKKYYNSSKTESDKDIYNKQITLFENKINELVYKLYDLSDEEIKMVESI